MDTEKWGTTERITSAALDKIESFVEGGDDYPENFLYQITLCDKVIEVHSSGKFLKKHKEQIRKVLKSLPDLKVKFEIYTDLRACKYGDLPHDFNDDGICSNCFGDAGFPERIC